MMESAKVHIALIQRLRNRLEALNECTNGCGPMSEPEVISCQCVTPENPYPEPLQWNVRKCPVCGLESFSLSCNEDMSTDPPQV